MRLKPGEFDGTEPLVPCEETAVLLAALLAGAHLRSTGSFDAETAERIAADHPSTFLKSRFTLGF